jgi:hypothetical protein
MERKEARPTAAEQDQWQDFLPGVSTLMSEPVKDPRGALEKDQFGMPIRKAQPESVPSAAPEGEQEDEEETEDTPQTATTDAAVDDGIGSHEDGAPKTSSSNDDPARTSSPKPHTSARAEGTVGSGGPVWSGQLVRGLSPPSSLASPAPLHL